MSEIDISVEFRVKKDLKAEDFEVQIVPPLEYENPEKTKDLASSKA